MTERKRLISICVPVFNEERNIELLYAALVPVMQQVRDRYDFELLFTDNRSTDRTFEILTNRRTAILASRRFRFSRNFSSEHPIFTAYRQCTRGDGVVRIDCDLQDPPSRDTQFAAKWEAGYQVVYGIRATPPGNRWWMRYGPEDFLSFSTNSRVEDPLPHDAGDFRWSTGAS